MIQQITEEIFQYVMQKKEFQIGFQPIVSVSKGKPIGVEALLRASCRGEAVSPEALFTYAREHGHVGKLDLLCLGQAFQEYAAASISVLLFVNIENNLLKFYLRYAEKLICALDSYGISRNRIVIELNEKNIQSADLITEAVSVFRQAGFLIALDDVGTGYSNLRRIVLAEPDIIKIDRSIIKNISQNFYQQEILRSITALGQKTGAVTIAEGVENTDETVCCLLCGVDWFQGFYFDKALPPHRISLLNYKSETGQIASLYRQKAVLQMQQQVKQMSLQKKFFHQLLRSLSMSTKAEQEEIIRRYLDLHACSECVYILDESGNQLTDTIFHPLAIIRNRSMFSPMKKGDCHISKQYYYFIVHRLGKLYVSPRYISQATGHFCQTISSSFQSEEGLRIVCVDFLA